VDSHRVLARECYKGRLEINLFVDKVNLALGDSSFNRQELEAVGYKNTGVLPILMNASKFDGPANPVTEAIFRNGKTTLLFVGRLIPNKKFEDLIKTFHIYKKHFNPDSQLILAGDYRGLERYLTSLQELVARLKIAEVHFSGHIEFSELLAFYRVADFYVSLSEHEGFGVPILEAFINKIPVIGFAAGAVEETMNGGGVVITEKDFLKVAALIDRIQRDEALKASIIEGQLKALKKFNRKNVSRILLGHIEKVSRG
jgi:glycosyltransferase involved in cell wall biosynthesis